MLDVIFVSMVFISGLLTVFAYTALSSEMELIGEYSLAISYLMSGISLILSMFLIKPEYIPFCVVSLIIFITTPIYIYRKISKD